MFKTGMGGILNACCMVLTGANPIFLPMALAIIALTCGYLLRIIRVKVADPKAPLPTWNNWAELFVSGLTWLVIQFGYIAVLAVTVVILSLAAAYAGAFSQMNNVGAVWAVFSLLVLSFASLAISFITPFAMVNFAVCEQVSAGFALKTITAHIKANKKAFLLAWILSTGIGWLSVALPIASVLGIFLMPTTVFIAYLFSALIAAQAWGQDSRASIEPANAEVGQVS